MYWKQHWFSFPAAVYCVLCQWEMGNEKQLTDQLNELMKQLNAASIQLGVYFFKLRDNAFRIISQCNVHV